MRITLVHFNILSPDEQKPEVAVLVTDLVDAQMVDPTEIFELGPSCQLGAEIGNR